MTLPSYSRYQKTGQLRSDNVARMKRLLPELQIFEASHNLDVSCIDILRKLNVTVSSRYYSEERGYGWIHGGKIGHWCSFLRFLVKCRDMRYDFCVWMEDDLKLTASMVNDIKKHFDHNDKSIVSLGTGDELNVVSGKRVAKLISHFYNYKIEWPLDVAMHREGLRNSKKLFDGRLFHDKQDSTLVCADCELLYYTNVNNAKI